MAAGPSRPAIERLAVSVYEVPTDAPESDGTLAWDATKAVVVEARAGGATGLGYSYADAAAGRLVAEHLRDAVTGTDALAVPAAWEAMVRRVKMKVGRRPEEDERRVGLARRAIGPECGLMVDANGAYTRKQALAQAEAFAGHGVTWFEEPVSSDD
ncbi:MAG TPA: enolase C-terminal domain-like protein, partial [Thermoanaerobaculia bacterium]